MANENIIQGINQSRAGIHAVPNDMYGQQILSARGFVTRQVTLSGKTEVEVPFGCYEAVIVAENPITVYESDDTYTESNKAGTGNITYGTGITGTTVTIPTYSGNFWVTGTDTVIDIMFLSLKK